MQSTYIFHGCKGNPKCIDTQVRFGDLQILQNSWKMPRVFPWELNVQFRSDVTADVRRGNLPKTARICDGYIWTRHTSANCIKGPCYSTIRDLYQTLDMRIFDHTFGDVVKGPCTLDSHCATTPFSNRTSFVMICRMAAVSHPACFAIVNVYPTP